MPSAHIDDAARAQLHAITPAQTCASRAAQTLHAPQRSRTTVCPGDNAACL
ncbi:hypothetical protein XCR_0683 [Xanthomonas campestris pv. raphani 756C]|nr:hypothetical protein XCR_0683 [Xanthomonas campestris pv. raphani 756C]